MCQQTDDNPQTILQHQMRQQRIHGVHEQIQQQQARQVIMAQQGMCGNITPGIPVGNSMGQISPQQIARLQQQMRLRQVRTCCSPDISRLPWPNHPNTCRHAIGSSPCSNRPPSRAKTRTRAGRWARSSRCNLNNLLGYSKLSNKPSNGPSSSRLDKCIRQTLPCELPR